MNLHQAAEHEIEFIVPHAASFPSGEAVASAMGVRQKLNSEAVNLDSNMLSCAQKVRSPPLMVRNFRFRLAAISDIARCRDCVLYRNSQDTVLSIRTFECGWNCGLFLTFGTSWHCCDRLTEFRGQCICGGRSSGRRRLLERSAPLSFQSS